MNKAIDIGPYLVRFHRFGCDATAFGRDWHFTTPLGERKARTAAEVEAVLSELDGAGIHVCHCCGGDGWGDGWRQLYGGSTERRACKGIGYVAMRGGV